jgi:hypothetical protein
MDDRLFPERNCHWDVSGLSLYGQGWRGCSAAHIPVPAQRSPGGGKKCESSELSLFLRRYRFRVYRVVLYRFGVISFLVWEQRPESGGAISAGFGVVGEHAERQEVFERCVDAVTAEMAMRESIDSISGQSVGGCVEGLLSSKLSSNSMFGQRRC